MIYPREVPRYDTESLHADAGNSLAQTTEQWITSKAGVGVGDDDTGNNGGAAGAPRYSRRLSDKVLIAFHHACDQADFEVADQLLQVPELMLTRRPLSADTNRRRSMESLVAAHERLWHLRHPHTTQE